MKIPPLVDFEQVSLPFLLRRHPPRVLEWGLQVPIATIRDWDYYLPPLWSQYYRETMKLQKRCVRRRFKIDDRMIALFGSRRRMLEELNLPQRYRDSYLPEYASLRIEYTVRGLFKGETRSQKGQRFVLVGEYDAKLR